MDEKDRLIKKYWELAQKCTTPGKQVAFFNQYLEAFELDPDEGEDLQNCWASYRVGEVIDDDQLDELKEKDWIDLPTKFKLYAFGYCIEDGMEYCEFQEEVR